MKSGSEAFPAMLLQEEIVLQLKSVRYRKNMPCPVPMRHICAFENRMPETAPGDLLSFFMPVELHFLPVV